MEWTTRALHERCTPQLAHAGGGEGAARVTELESAEQALPGAEVIGGALHVGPQRVGVLGGHDRLAEPVVEVLAQADDARRLAAAQDRAGVELGGLAGLAAVEQALDAADVG